MNSDRRCRFASMKAACGSRGAFGALKIKSALKRAQSVAIHPSAFCLKLDAVGFGEDDREGGADTHGRFEVNRAEMLLDDRFYDRKTKAGSSHFS